MLQNPESILKHGVFPETHCLLLFLSLSQCGRMFSFLCPGKGEESYPDLLALVIAVIVTIIVSMGVKNSVGFNNVLNVINLTVWVFIMIAGLFFVNGDNWSEGQFLPFGWSGVSVLYTIQYVIINSSLKLKLLPGHIGPAPHTRYYFKQGSP